MSDTQTTAGCGLDEPPCSDVPQWWFKPIHEQNELTAPPDTIEFLKMWTGETFVHINGTAFWDSENKCLDRKSLMYNGITHWRIPNAAHQLRADAKRLTVD